MNVEKCLAQAEHNRSVANALSSATPISLQWAVTCVFYAGLYYVNAYLSHFALPTPLTHPERDQCVMRSMRPVYRAYKGLKVESERARYTLHQPTTAEFEISKRKVNEIEQFVRERLPTPDLH